MKIDRLITLSQFVDERSNDVVELLSTLFRSIVKYNRFLKQLLTKEMFINPYGEEPTNEFRVVSDEEHLINYSKWEKAEKKVIFKGWKEFNTTNPYYVEIHIMIRSTNHIIRFYEHDYKIWLTKLYEHGSRWEIKIKSIQDVAIAIKGELELQNVKL